jgi:mRNA-degrading endonuclease toxin of MazEF toxin-antitoxin module
MPVPSKGDVVLAYFPQEDQSTSDIRPCLVLSVSESGFVAAKITTTNLPRPWTFKLDRGIAMTCSGGILKDSWVNLRRCETIPTKDMTRIVATLKPEVFKEICGILANIIKR